MKAYIIALTITLTACSVYAKEYHVATTGLDENIGSISKPFKMILAAAQIARPGDVITVHEEVNSEHIDRGLFLLVDEIKCVVDCWRTGYNHHRPHSSLACMTYAGLAALRSRTGCAGLHTQETDEAKTCRMPSWRQDHEKADRSFES